MQCKGAHHLFYLVSCFLLSPVFDLLCVLLGLLLFVISLYKHLDFNFYSSASYHFSLLFPFSLFGYCSLTFVFSLPLWITLFPPFTDFLVQVQKRETIKMHAELIIFIWKFAFIFNTQVTIFWFQMGLLGLYIIFLVIFVAITDPHDNFQVFDKF